MKKGGPSMKAVQQQRQFIPQQQQCIPQQQFIPQQMMNVMPMSNMMPTFARRGSDTHLENDDDDDERYGAASDGEAGETLESIGEGSTGPPQAAASSSGQEVYALPGWHTVLRDEDNRVSVTRRDLTAHIRFEAIPKSGSDVYRKVRLVNSTNALLPPGPVSVYVDHAYVCASTLDAVGVNQPFWMYIGVEAGVSVTRKLLKQFKGKRVGFMKDGKMITDLQYEISVKNGLRIPAEVVVWDQVPVAEAKGVEVMIIEPTFGTDAKMKVKKNADGMIEWYTELPPGGEATFPLEFSVAQPG